MGTPAGRVGSSSRLRAHAGKPLPSHGAVPQMANGQKAERLHLCPARSGSAAGAGSDFPPKALTLAPATDLLFACAARAIHASDHHQGPEFLGAGEDLPEHDAG